MNNDYEKAVIAGIMVGFIIGYIVAKMAVVFLIGALEFAPLFIGVGIIHMVFMKAHDDGK